MAASVAAGLLLGIRYRYPVALLASIAAVVIGAFVGVFGGHGRVAVAWSAVGAGVALQVSYLLGAFAKTAAIRWRSHRR